MRSLTLVHLLTASAIALAGCNTPRGIGNSGQILKGAEAENADFQVVHMTRATARQVQSWPVINTTPTAGWISKKQGSANNTLQPGDKLNLTIWESDNVALLATTGQKNVTMTNVQVDSDGSIFLPYVDKVHIANMTPEQARATIQSKMVASVPSAQVLLDHLPGRKSSVDLVSGVPKPGPVVLPSRDFTVMSLIAAGGGLDPNLQNPYVRLIRGDRLYGISADKLLKNPSLDTTLVGGDKVYVEEDERYFIALGASGRKSQVAFPQEKVSALEALSLSGGLNDYRADAKGVLILRDYPQNLVGRGVNSPQKDRVIFAMDLTTADGLFSAGQFYLQGRDVVIVTESAINTTASVLTLIGSVLGLGRSAQALSNND